MHAPEAPKEGKNGKKKDLKVKIHNEDDGENFHFTADPSDSLDVVINELYSELGRERRQDDRLRCKKDGGDVFGFVGLTFKSYLDDGHCPELNWLFAGGTGGA